METEYLKRWRMALGGNAADGTGVTLTVEEQRLDSSLEAVYDSDRRGGLGSSAPKVSRWLGDIREFSHRPSCRSSRGMPSSVCISIRCLPRRRCWQQLSLTYIW